MKMNLSLLLLCLTSFHHGFTMEVKTESKTANQEQRVLKGVQGLNLVVVDTSGNGLPNDLSNVNIGAIGAAMSALHLSASDNKDSKDATDASVSNEQLAQELRDIKLWVLKYIGIPDNKHAGLLSSSEGKTFTQWVLQCVKEREAELWKSFFSKLQFGPEYTIEKIMADYKVPVMKANAAHKIVRAGNAELLTFSDGTTVEALVASLLAKILPTHGINPNNVKVFIIKAAPSNAGYTDLSFTEVIVDTLMVNQDFLKALKTATNTARYTCTFTDDKAFCTTMLRAVLPHAVRYLANQSEYKKLSMKHFLAVKKTELAQIDSPALATQIRDLIKKIQELQAVAADLEGALINQELLNDIQLYYNLVCDAFFPDTFVEDVSKFHNSYPTRRDCVAKLRRALDIEKHLLAH